ncbi:MAG: SAM-dependent methyltransferase [Clostridia bacterium]|nr:SAM-dependent methyltransferase [Clostridia bacterium]
MNFNISKRLLKCAEKITKNSRIADIGTDHAYVPIYLGLNKRITHAIASDINPGPLENARQNIRKYNLENIIETRISNGLENIESSEVDEVIIAGMGGNLISEILQKSLDQNKTFKKYILQPVQYDVKLREYLCRSGFDILHESIVESDKKIYIIIEVVYTGEKYNLTDLEKFLGKNIENNIKKQKDLCYKYLNKKLKELNNQKNGAEICRNFEKYKYCEKLIKEIEILKKL